MVMGHTTASIVLYGVDPSKRRQVDLLVDTGSTYTWVPKIPVGGTLGQTLDREEFSNDGRTNFEAGSRRSFDGVYWRAGYQNGRVC